MMEGLGIIALAKYGSNPWAFIILSGIVFLAWGEVYSLFSATSADAFGAKNIGSIYGVLYCAKGIAALLVPIANLIQEATGSWSTVLYIVASFDILAALCALVFLKPMLRKHMAKTDVLAKSRGLATATGSAGAPGPSSVGALHAALGTKA
jgi:MFS transporter, OFA family, oxalate/formate antiporter